MSSEAKKKSESSTIRDVSMVLNHSIQSKEDFLVDLKKKKEMYMRDPTAGPIEEPEKENECDLSLAIKRLKAGIDATKYNYSTMGMKRVILSLSSDEKSLVYKSAGSSAKCLFNKSKSYPVKKIANFLYGGSSSTFKKHNKQVLKLLSEHNSIKQNSSERELDKSHSLRIKSAADSQNCSQHCESGRQAEGEQEKERTDVSEHYSWECISIYRENFLSTLDFVICDTNDMMALCLFLHLRVHEGQERNMHKVLMYYKELKFKMKLEYEAWSRSIPFVALVQYAVLKTV